MNKHILESRTRAFAIAVIRLSESIKGGRAADVILRQLLRSATSIGANYREANRAESRRDFVHKIAIVEKEAAETLYWIELLADCDIAPAVPLEALRREADELVAIFTAIGRSTKAALGTMQVKDGLESESISDSGSDSISDFGFRISDFRDQTSSAKLHPPPRKSSRPAKPNPKSEIRNPKSK